MGEVAFIPVRASLMCGHLPETTYPVIHCHLDAETGWCHISRMSFCCFSPALQKPQKDASEMCLQGLAHLNKEGENSSNSDDVCFVSSWNESILIEDGKSDAKGKHQAMWHLKLRYCSKNKSQVLSTGHEEWALGKLWGCDYGMPLKYGNQNREQNKHMKQIPVHRLTCYTPDKKNVGLFYIIVWNSFVLTQRSLGWHL